MNRKINLVLVLLAMLTVGIASCSKKADAQERSGKSENVSDAPKRADNGQYLLGSKVQVYDANLESTNAYFTYFPDKMNNLELDDVVILNFGPPYIDAALFIGKNDKKDSIEFFRHCIDKSIEWAATAKQNNVRDLMKEIPPDGYDKDDITVWYGLNQPNYRRHEFAYLMFSFFVDADGKGKDGPWLILNYRTHDQLRRDEQGNYFCFREKDFARLKEMLSEQSLTKIADWQKSQAEQGALFE